MLVVTHEMASRAVADRVVFMDAGGWWRTSAGAVLRGPPVGPGPRVPVEGADALTPRRCAMKTMAMLGAMLMAAAAAGPAAAQSPTLDKISQSGTLTIGTRTGSPPFAYVNSKNEWVGFSIDLVEQLVVPALAKKLGKPIKLEKKESTPPTRIPLLTSSAGRPDRRTRPTPGRGGRRRLLDHLLRDRAPFRSEGVPIRHPGYRRPGIAAQQGSTNARINRERAPRASSASSRPARRLPGPIQGRSTPTPTRHPARRPQVEGAQSRPWEIVGASTRTSVRDGMRRNESDFRMWSTAPDGSIESASTSSCTRSGSAQGRAAYPMNPACAPSCSTRRSPSKQTPFPAFCHELPVRLVGAVDGQSGAWLLDASS